MIEQIQLTNFRKHRDLTVNLTGGLNVIRGPNEEGKSTINEAIAYAFYGARALRESLENTVTWGEPSRSLRVRVVFNFDGVPGFVSRGESGAEVKYGETLASGQSEVTRFFETLFRVNAKMASNLQIASQNKVRGALEGNQAVALIESLADFSLLETLVDRISTTRPCGNVNIVSDRLKRLKAAEAAPVPSEPDPAPVEAAMGHLRTVEASLAGAQAALDAITPQVTPSRALLNQAAALENAREKAKAKIESITKALAEPLPEVTFSDADIEEMRKLQAAEAAREKLWKLYSVTPPKCEHVWAGNRASFDAEAVRLMHEETSLLNLLSEAERQLTTAKMKRINEKSCALCKKDLSDVPEVVAINELADKDIALYTESVKNLKSRLAEVRESRAGMKAVSDQDAKLNSLYPTEYWDAEDTQVPPVRKWKGEVPKAEPDPVNYASLILKAQGEQRALATEQGRRAGLREELPALHTAAEADPIDTATSLALLEEYERAKLGVNNLTAEMLTARNNVRLAEQEYAHKTELRNQALAEAAKAAKEVEAVTKELSDMTFYNLLIDKIRKARPAVANKLWALVMSAVSHYTTKGRNEPSTVTRDGDGFKINGKAVDAYSGSAQDVLGLAIRLALVKTFLPHSPFMIMDEIASACDDERELHMLAMVLSADIPQVLLVTHSDAAESFATNLVQL